MGIEYSSGFCKKCNEQKKLIRKTPNHILHFLISIFTLGFWVIPWIILSMTKGNWRCDSCGETFSYFDFWSKIEEVGYVKSGAIVILVWVVLTVIFHLIF